VRFIAAKSNAGERQACCRMIASSWSFLIPAIGASAAAPPPSTPSERFAIYRKSIQLQRRARNGKEGTWTTRLKKFLCAAIFESCFVAIRNASNYRRLPIGSGLGTSSILSATVLRALAIILGRTLADHQLSDSVMQLEQRMTTGGGWQDQAGGIFPGAKLLITGPGLRQRVRVQPVQWNEERKAAFCQHLVLYNTGIQRMAKDLLRQVISRYLARENATIQVLHSIKTLAVEMSYAMAEGEWKHLGELLARHWQLNQVLDPHTTNAPINAIIDRARPYIHGAKLAGAGGGGFLMLMARDPDAAEELKRELTQHSREGGGVVSYYIAEQGLRVRVDGVSVVSDMAARSSNTVNSNRSVDETMLVPAPTN
jgi:galactokinase/mevalonate kinase-like predicted kinase